MSEDKLTTNDFLGGFLLIYGGLSFAVGVVAGAAAASAIWWLCV